MDIINYLHRWTTSSGPPTHERTTWTIRRYVVKFIFLASSEETDYQRDCGSADLSCGLVNILCGSANISCWSADISCESADISRGSAGISCVSAVISRGSAVISCCNEYGQELALLSKITAKITQSSTKKAILIYLPPVMK